jgi:pyridoxine 5-phosphate synthase
MIPSQATSDHGWDFEGKGNFLRSVVQRLKKGGARVSLFCDPDATRSALEAAKATVQTGWSSTPGPMAAPMTTRRVPRKSSQSSKPRAIAAELGLGINAGHDLTVDNMPALARALPNLLEVSIGHGLTADALEYGMAETVRRFVRACG